MKWMYKFLVLSTFFNIITKQHHHVLTFFVKDLGKPKFKVPQYPFVGITKKIVKENTKAKVPKSVFALYHGYIALSNEYGQITFPRQTHKTDFELLIVDKVEPVLMFPHTLSHWNIAKDTPAKIYSIKRHKKKDMTYWEIKSGTPPKNRKISLETIVMIAEPKNVIVPTGTFLTTDLPQLVLPELYIKKNFDSVNNALFVLGIKKFFGSVNFDYEVKEKGHSKLVK